MTPALARTPAALCLIVGLLAPAGLTGQAPALRPDTAVAAAVPPSGRSYTLVSRVLEEERRVRVALPPSHARTDRPYPLVVVLDGEALFGTVAAAAAALARAGHMPESVVVGVENTDRVRDLSPPGIPVSGNDGAGRADRFLRFLAEELGPAVAHELRAAGPATLVGHSLGGLFAVYALAERPDRFGSALALDAPMHLGDGAATGLLPGSGPARSVPVRLVSLEARFGWPGPAWDELVAAAPEPWTLVREPVESESHGSMAWPGSYRGLKALFADYSTVEPGATPPVERLRRFDATVSSDAALPPPAQLLEDAATDLVGARELDRAESVIRRLAAGYGDGPAVERLRDRMEAARSRPLDGPSLEELRATPLPPAGAVRPLLGTWEGHTRVEGASRRVPLRLDIRLVDGRPAAEIAVGGAPARAVEYMVVDGPTLHVGYMNGMRPRGMLVYEGTVEDDVFQGTFELRGVEFRLPDGRELPVTRFRLERAGRP